MEWPRHPPTLTDDVVQLRPLEPADVDDLVVACTDAQSRLFTAVPDPYGRSDAIDFVDRSADATWPSFVLAITVGDDRFAGTCGLRIEDEEAGVTSIGFMVTPVLRNRGVAGRAVRLLVASAWSYGAHRVELEAFAANSASRAVAVRCGFCEEGMRRSAAMDSDGRRDLVLFAIVRPTLERPDISQTGPYVAD